MAEKRKDFKERLVEDLKKYRWLTDPFLLALQKEKQQRILQVGFAATVPIREEAFNLEELKLETKSATSHRRRELDRIKQVSGYEFALNGHAVPDDLFQETGRQIF